MELTDLTHICKMPETQQRRDSNGSRCAGGDGVWLRVIRGQCMRRLQFAINKNRTSPL